MNIEDRTKKLLKQGYKKYYDILTLYGKAVRIADKAIAADSKCIEAYELKYDLAHFINSCGLEIHVLSEILRIDSKNAQAHERLAMHLYNKHAKNTALEHALKAIELNKKSSIAYSVIIQFFTENKNYESALKYCDLSVRHTPSPASYSKRGEIHYRLENYDLAAKDFSSAINSHKRIAPFPPNAEFYLSRAICKHAQDDNKGAMRDLNLLIKNYPKEKIRTERTITLIAGNNFKRHKKLFDRILHF